MNAARLLSFRLDGVDAVGFDLDGTLLDHPAAAAVGTRALADHFGIEHTPAFLDAWFAVEDEHFGAWSEGRLTWQGQRRARIADMRAAFGLAPLAEADADAAFTVFIDAYRTGWSVYGDVVETLERLRAAGVRVGVLTNGPGEQQRAKLTHIGIADLVDVVCAADEIGAAKPEVAAFDALLTALGTTRERTVFVGDHPALDGVAAREAGIRSALVRSRSRGIAELPSAVRRAAASVMPTVAASGR